MPDDKADAVAFAERMLALGPGHRATWAAYGPQAVRDLKDALEAETKRVETLEGAAGKLWAALNPWSISEYARGPLEALRLVLAEGQKARALLPETEAPDAQTG